MMRHKVIPWAIALFLFQAWTVLHYRDSTKQNSVARFDLETAVLIPGAEKSFLALAKNNNMSYVSNFRRDSRVAEDIEPRLQGGGRKTAPAAADSSLSDLPSSPSPRPPLTASLPPKPSIYDEQVSLESRTFRNTKNAENPGASNCVSWCMDAKKKYDVISGKSWGSLRGDARTKWGQCGCDVVVATGRPFSCGAKWGKSYLESWQHSERDHCGRKGSSAVRCRTQVSSASKACIFENIVIDFSRAFPASNSRRFQTGFLRASCDKGSAVAAPPQALLSPLALPKCDYVEKVPTMFMSHDLIFNVGHTVSDFWIVWITMRALEQDFGNYQLVNMDAIRGNGPAGRGSRVTFKDHPDHISPFFEQYEKWFGRGMRKAIDYGRKSVCFKKAVFQALPGPGHIWDSLKSAGENLTTERCANEEKDSWLLREYSAFNRKMWGLLPAKPQEDILGAPTITLVVRKGSGDRSFANEDGVIEVLRGIPGVGDIRVIDFAAIGFGEQKSLVHNTSLLIGMHGAALFHLLEMDIGARPTAIIEMYHKKWSQPQYPPPSVSTMAKFLGIDYYVLRSNETETPQEISKRGTGTMVDTDGLRSVAATAIAKLLLRSKGKRPS